MVPRQAGGTDEPLSWTQLVQPGASQQICVRFLERHPPPKLREPKALRVDTDAASFPNESPGRLAPKARDSFPMSCLMT